MTLLEHDPQNPEADDANVAVEDLSVGYRVRGQLRMALRNFSLSIGSGQSFGLVGESGCGKTTFANTLIRYLPSNGKVTGGSVRIAGQDVLTADGDQLRRLRTDTVAMVYQSAGRALNPTMRIGRQLAESYVVRGSSWREGHERALAILRRVQIADAALVMNRYPGELSGGMQQRVVIGMALAKNPELLILDEPTTGLDATVEAEVLDLISTLKRELNTSLLLISHNLSVVAQMCDRVGILYAGRLIEEGPTVDVFRRPEHPYTASLLGSVPRHGMAKSSERLVSIPGSLPVMGDIPVGCVFHPRCPHAQEQCRVTEPPVSLTGDHRHRCFFPERVPQLAVPDTVAYAPDSVAPQPASDSDVVLDLRSINKTFGAGPARVQVLTDVDLQIRAGETVGLVGESGSGKSTLARIIVGLTAPDDGSEVTLFAENLKKHVSQRTKSQVRAMQIVFQNPDTALNERHTVRGIIWRTARLQKLSRSEREQLIADLTRHVRLSQESLNARPKALSGGMKQRVAVARAFASAPNVVVLDEPTSALDVSVQAAILNLLVALQDEKQTAYLFISHDLAVVRYVSDRVVVMYLGRIMESGSTPDVFAPPYHPYTEALLSTSVLNGPNTERIRLHGDPPSVADPPTGCVFHTRCPRKIGEICRTDAPPVQRGDGGHTIRCHIPWNELARRQKTARATEDH